MTKTATRTWTQTDIHADDIREGDVLELEGREEYCHLIVEKRVMCNGGVRVTYVDDLTGMVDATFFIALGTRVVRWEAS